jgi:hypothetical protein
MSSMRAISVAIIMTCASAACGDDDTDNGGGGNPDAGAMLREVSCIDESFEALTLHEEPNDATVREESKDGDTFNSFIDASGGGSAPTKSFVYVKFTEEGLKRVDVSDEDAFSSLDWDLASRRFVLRLNSGVSGPGDVTAARTAPRTEFDSVAKVPEDLDFRTEEYFTDNCEFISDGSGIGSPGTALSSFWSYSACVAMTHNVYVLALQDERHVKLEVMSYYTPSNQEICDETGTLGRPETAGPGNMRIRWAFLD